MEFIQQNWEHIVIIYLALNTFLKSVHDAIDSTPVESNKTVLDKILNVMDKISSYLILGKRK